MISPLLTLPGLRPAAVATPVRICLNNMKPEFSEFLKGYSLEAVISTIKH
jgi:hypothetical protein